MVYNILLNAGNYSNAQQSTTAGGIAGAFGAFFAGLTLLYIVILLLPIVIALTIRIIYGFITSGIAGEKGYNKIGFFWYGFLFFPIAVGVAILAEPKPEAYKVPSEEQQIAKYREMYEAGTMSWTEFNEKKEEIERKKYFK